MLVFGIKQNPCIYFWHLYYIMVLKVLPGKLFCKVFYLNDPLCKELKALCFLMPSERADVPLEDSFHVFV